MPAYLDHNATAPLRPVARAAWLAAQDAAWGNPGSVHAAGQRARAALDAARARIARTLGCQAHELVLTSGGSEANALAIHAACHGAPEGEILASAVEHSSVLRGAAQQAACSLRVLPVDGAGRLAPATLAAAAGPRTRLACVQFANNELGTRQDVAGLVAALRAAAPGAALLLDCCQGAGKAALDLGALGVDFASVAGHKFGAPKGCGLLYARNGRRVPALIAGGRQQQDRRSGTEDAAAAAALAAALGEAAAEAAVADARERALLAGAWARISADLPQARWLAHEAERLPGTMSLVHPGVRSQALVVRLDLAGCAVSSGAACMALRGEPSHVVAALGLPAALAGSVVRVSIGATTTAAELETFAAAYVREVRALLAVP